MAAQRSRRAPSRIGYDGRTLRWLPLALLALWPALAFARPKVAVVPLDGDSRGKVSAVVVDAANDHATVTRPAKVERAMDKLGLATLDKRALKKLRIELEVEVVIHGKVEKDRGKRHLVLVLSGRGKKTMTIDVVIKGSPRQFEKELSARLDKKLDELTGGDEDPDDDDAPKKLTADDRPKRKHDDDRPKKRVAADDDAASTHKRHHRGDDGDDADDGDDGNGDEGDDGIGRRGKHHRRHHRTRRNPMTGAAVWVDLGAEVARRTLTWDTTGGTGTPPRVGTAAAAGRVGGEVYPFSFDTPTGGAAGLGLYGEYARTVGLGIAVPNTTLTAPIDEGHYALGVRYRFVFGDSTLALGAAYWRRYYKAERGGLMMASQLDMPDVDYTAVAPGALVRFVAIPSVSAFAGLDLPLVLKSGEISSATSYGRGTIIAFDVTAGVQILLGPHYAVQLAAAFDQVGTSFEAAPNSLAATRNVSAATDRRYGLNATIGILY